MQDAVDALEFALTAAGLAVSEPRDPARADLVVDTPDGRSYEVHVMVTSIATADDVSRVVHWRGEGVVPILIADEMPESRRQELDERDLSWLDRRGHLRLTATGLFVDASFTPDRSA